MPMAYDNTTGRSYSEATRAFVAAQDWTAGGATTLTVYFRGAPDNGAGQLYVTINGAKVLYSGGASALTLPVWKQWNIDLGSIAADLKAVKTLAIGVSGSGKGTLYVDDILLYRGARAAVQPVNPGTGALAAYYALNGDLKDGSGHGLAGTATGEPAFVDGPTGYGQALRFDGIDDLVDLPIGSLLSTLGSSSFATWVNFSGAEGSGQRIFDFGTGINAYMFLGPRLGDTGILRFAITTAGTSGESGVKGPAGLPTGWHHVAVVVDGASSALCLYLDGEAVGTGTTKTLPKDLGKTTQNRLGQSQTSTDAFFNGMLDEFRIYSRALSTAEVRYLAGDR
jgi:hypothetical protein